MTNPCRLALTALGALALVSSSALALAQSKDPIPEVTVTVHKPVSKLGRDVNGRPVEVVQLTREVSYADLDISTYSGARALHARIKTAATAVCEELASKYPWASEYNLPAGSCVQEAIDSATPRLNAAIASAEKARSASTAGKQE